MLWFVIALMLLVAVLVVAWPQFREEKEFSLRSALAITCILVFSVGLYSQIGQPGVQSADGPLSNIEDMVDSLAQRLETHLEAAGFGAGRDVEVINAGVPSLPPANNLNWYQQVGKRYRPDIEG